MAAQPPAGTPSAAELAYCRAVRTLRGNVCG